MADIARSEESAPIVLSYLGAGKTAMSGNFLQTFGRSYFVIFYPQRRRLLLNEPTFHELRK